MWYLLKIHLEIFGLCCFLLFFPINTLPSQIQAKPTDSQFFTILSRDFQKCFNPYVKASIESHVKYLLNNLNILLLSSLLITTRYPKGGKKADTVLFFLKIFQVPLLVPRIANFLKHATMSLQVCTIFAPPIVYCI